MFARRIGKDAVLRLRKIERESMRRSPELVRHLDLPEAYRQARYQGGVLEGVAEVERRHGMVESVGPFGLTLAADDAAVRARAEAVAKECEKVGQRIMRDLVDDMAEAERQGRAAQFASDLARAIYDQTAAICRSKYGHDMPGLPEDWGTMQIMGRVRRLWCAKWWRRQMRSAYARWREAQYVRLGRVRKGLALYVSDDGLSYRREQRRRNDDLLHALVAVSDAGDCLSLADVADATVSNPRLRRNECMTRLRGIEDFADARGHASEFWTVTAPSSFHRYRMTGAGMYRLNRKYSGATPRDAQAHLAAVWVHARAEFHKAGLTVYGFRVAEPHHDGCPHWHMLVFGPADDLRRAREIMRRQALAVDGDEAGAGKRRFVVEEIDRARGSAVGYVAKYISKHLDGEGMAGLTDENGAAISEAIARVDAWRSIWGIRQFQFFHTGAVTVWRELRRMKEEPTGAIREAWQAVQGEQVGGSGARADWAAFLDAIERQPVRIVTAEAGRGEYGEPLQQIKGLECGGVCYLTRCKSWEIRERGDAARLGLVSITVTDTDTHGGAPPD